VALPSMMVVSFYDRRQNFVTKCENFITMATGDTVGTNLNDTIIYADPENTPVRNRHKNVRRISYTARDVTCLHLGLEAHDLGLGLASCSPALAMALALALPPKALTLALS